MSSSSPPSSARRRERGRPHTVLVVDDSAFMRRVISDILSSTDEFKVIGTARDGNDALKKVHQLDPDLVTMDVEMPGLDGLAALGYIMSETPRPVVMLSAFTVAGGDATLRALDYGAVDFVSKPSGTISLNLETVSDRLLEALRKAGIPILGEAVGGDYGRSVRFNVGEGRTVVSSVGKVDVVL